MTQSFLKYKWAGEGGRERKQRERERARKPQRKQQHSLSLILHAAVFGFICRSRRLLPLLPALSLPLPCPFSAAFPAQLPQPHCLRPGSSTDVHNLNENVNAAFGSSLQLL